MCLISNVVLIALKPLKVYKVLNGRFLLFRTVLGLELVSPSHRHRPKDIDTVIKTTAIGFSKGFGYSVFNSVSFARKYIKKLAHKGFPEETPIIREMIIPIGTKYAHGVIAEGFIGEGLPAIRTERLNYKEKN